MNDYDYNQYCVKYNYLDFYDNFYVDDNDAITRMYYSCLNNL